MIARSRRKKQEREEGCCLRKKRKGEEKKKKRKKSISIVSVTPMRICHIQHTMRYIHTYSTYVGPISYRGTYYIIIIYDFLAARLYGVITRMRIPTYL